MIFREKSQMVYNKLKEYGKNIDITIIIHVIIYIIINCLFTNVFFNMLTIDSTINAIQYIKALCENPKNDIIKKYNLNKVCENDIITQKIKNYIEAKYPQHLNKFNFNNEGYIDTPKKYVLYGITHALSTLVSYVLWTDSKIINTILTAMALPIVHIFFISNIYFERIYTYVKKKLKNLLIYVCSKTTAYVINTLSETCLNSDPKIDYIELSSYYENIFGSVTTTIIFIKTVVIQTVIHYIKKTNNTIYYYMVDIIHKYQIESYKASGLSNESKTKHIAELIRKRKWDEFQKPKTVNMLFELFDTKSAYSIKLEMFINNIQLNFIRIITLWSLSNLSPILSLLIDAYFVFIDNKFGINYDYTAYFLSGPFLYVNKLFGTILIVLSNIILKPILDYIEEKEYIVKYIIRKKEQLLYLLLIPVIWKFTWFTLIIPPVIFYINKDKRIFGLTSGAIILGFFSDYQILHIGITIILSIITNNIMNAPIEKPPIVVINFIDNYAGNKRQTETKGKIVRYVENDDPIPEKITRANICKMISSYFL